MTSFYLDENVSLELVSLLVERGHEALAARRLLPAHTSDHIHLATATRSKWVLVTHDRGDFRLLHRAWRDWFAEWGTPPLPEHAGIVHLPQPPTLSVEQAADVLDTFFRDSEPTLESANRFVSWSRTHGWRQLD